MSSPQHPAVSALLKVLAEASAGGETASTDFESLTAHQNSTHGVPGYLVSLRGSSPYFVGPDGRVQHLEAHDRPRMDDEYVLELTKFGGIAGIRQNVKLSEFDGTLTEEDAVTLGKLLEETKFFDIERVDDSGPTINDGFTYTIFVAHGRFNRTVTAAEGRANATLTQLGPLLNWLVPKLPDAFPRPVLD